MNRIDNAWQILRNKEICNLDESCQHDFVEITQDKKWGVVTWNICLKCKGTEHSARDTSQSGLARQHRANYQTAHAGHPRGAKIEYGNPTMIGRDYDE